MLFNIIDFKYFILSLSIGLLYIYLSNDYKKVVVIYPNPHNLDKFTYIDQAENCFNYELSETTCPSNTNEYVNVGMKY